MGVHNIGEYVRYHQQKLQAENAAAAAAAVPKKAGVLTISSVSAFKEQCIAGSEDKLVVLDCFATWCGPCKMIAPKVVEMSNAYPQATFVKVDVDEAPEVAGQLEIRAMPTFVLFKNGSKVDELVGADPRKLEELVKKHL